MNGSVGGKQQEATLAQALRSYRGRHPQAADSLEGIRQWWLPSAMRTVPMQQLKMALEEMIANGEVTRSSLPDGSDLYACTAPKPQPDRQ